MGNPSTLRVGLVGCYFPFFKKAGSSTTGLASLLCESDKVESVEVFAGGTPSSAETIPHDKLSIVCRWVVGNPLSIVRMLLGLRARLRKLDIVIFNIHLTSYGYSNSTNTFGLISTLIVRLLSPCKTWIILHTIIEAQKLELVGYRSNGLAQFTGRAIERLFAIGGGLIIPMPILSSIEAESILKRAESFNIPYLDAIPGWILSSAQSRTDCSMKSLSGTIHKPPLGLPPPGTISVAPKNGTIAIGERPTSNRVLLFGSWGPQKDINVSLRACRIVSRTVPEFDLTIAGSINDRFPEYSELLAREISLFDAGRVRAVWNPDERQVFDLFRQSDLIILPYNALPGFSGVLNLSAFHNLKAIAYDVPALRQYAEELGIEVVFVKAGDLEELTAALLRAVKQPQRDPVEADVHNRRFRLALGAVNELLARLTRSNTNLGDS
jgi:glycosyltransferase involved in cell wall biosynthesis